MTLRPYYGGDNKHQPTLSPGGGDTVSPPYKKVNSKKVFEEHSSSELQVVMEQLHGIGIDADDEFGLQLIRRSRAGCPDVTISEIVHFTQVKARYRGVHKSLTGFLLTAVPACLMGESFRLYRQAEIARVASERQAWIEMRSEAEQTLNSRKGRESWEIDNAESYAAVASRATALGIRPAARIIKPH